MPRTVTTLPVTEKTVAQEWDDNTKLGNWDHFRTSPIDRIIIHTMVGYAQGADERFNDPTSNVSAHYGVLQTGEIWHWVDEVNTAYHSGNLDMNRRSIGIEHEDNGDPNSVRPDALYQSSAKLVKDICEYYNIPIDRDHILKHSEVIATGCPDALDIDKIVSLAQGNQPDPLAACEVSRDTNWNALNVIYKVLEINPDPNEENKITQAQEAATQIQQLIDYKNSHRDSIQPVQPNSNPVNQESQVPGLENSQQIPSTQSNPQAQEVPQVPSIDIGQLIGSFINWLLHRNEVTK